MNGYQSAILFLGAAGVLAVGFSDNRWGVAESGWFDTHQRDTEAHVIGRLVQSRQQRLFSYAGFNGVGVDQPPPPGPRRWPADRVRAQTEAFLDHGTFAYYDPYLSQPGGQGLLFSLLDACLPLDPARKLELFSQVTAWLTDGVLAGVVVWLRVELGWLAALAALGSMTMSPWLVVFGNRLWWSLWSFSLPFLAFAVLISLRPPGKLRLWVFFGT